MKKNNCSLKKLTHLILLLVSPLFTNAQWSLTNGFGATPFAMAVQDSNIFAGGSGGVYLTTNKGNNWNSVSSGLPSGTIYSLIVRNDTLLAGTLYGVYISTNLGSSWVPDTTGLPFTSGQCVVSSLIFKDTLVFAGASSKGIYKRGINSSSWSSANSGILSSTSTTVNTFTIKGSTLYAGTDSQSRVYKSTNNGSNWSLINAGFPSNTQIKALAAVGTDIFAGTYNDDIYKSTNDGASWSLFNNGIPANTLQIRAFVVYNDNIFAGSSDDGVFLLLKNDTIWTEVTENLTVKKIWSLAISDSSIYAGGWDGGSGRDVAIRKLSDFIPDTAGIPTGDNNLCEGIVSSSYTTSGSNFATSYIWDISPTNAGTTVDSGLTATINWDSAFSGTVTIKVQAVNGFGDGLYSNDLTVNIYPLPIIQLGNDTAVCDGNNITLRVDPTYTVYNWNSGLSSNDSLSVTMSGDYYVYVTDANNCSNYSDTININFYPLANINLGKDTAICVSDSIILVADSGFISYNWSNNFTTSSITVTQTNSYFVSITDSNGCSAISDTVTVTVNSLPIATITPSGSTTICAGDSVTLDAGSGFANYNWSNSATTQTITATQANIYYATVTNNNNCSSNSDTITVSVNPLPTSTILINDSTTVCNGDSVELDAGSGFNNYSWSNGATSQTINVKQSNNYYAVVTDANGCNSNSDTVAIIVINPIITITPNGSISICSGDSIVLNATSGFTSYNWSNNDTISSIIVIQANSYFLSITDSNGCPAISDTVTITVNSLPIATITPTGSTTICAGNSVTLDAGSGFVNYNWSNSATTQTITATQDNIYYATVSDNNNCSANSDTVTVTVNILPTISLGSDTTILSNQSITLDAGNGFTSYKWNDNSTTQTLAVDGSILDTITYTYFVIVTDSNNCTNSDTILITIQKAVGVQHVIQNTFVKIYPNPSNDILYIETSNEQNKNLKIEIVNINGQVLYSGQFKSNSQKQKQQIDMSDYSKGNYFLKVYTNDKLIVEKIILN